jgi:ABC-type transport system involved in multi-copper enzyme maturation permease subunit
VSWRVVARKDVSDAGRSRSLWALTGLLAVAFVGYAVAHGYLGAETFTAFLGGLTAVVASLLPILGIGIGYKSIVHERTSGSLFLTLSFPHSRRDVVLGTFLGRATVLFVPTLAALSVAGVVGAVLYGTDGAALYPLFLLATGLYGVAFVGITVALSMSTTAERRITYGALGSYLLLVQFWENLHSLTVLVLHRFDFTVLADMPDWTLLFRLLKPSESYYRLVRAGFDVGFAGRYVGEGAPLYVGWLMALALLAAWVAVPLALGFRRFRRADL